MEEAKQAALHDASIAKERERVAEAWPLQDCKVSLTAEVCCNWNIIQSISIGGAYQHSV